MSFRLLFYIAILLFASCKKESSCIKKTGVNMVKEIKLDDFYAVVMQDEPDVILIQDTVNKAVIHAGEFVIEHISLKNMNGRIFIENNNRCNFLREYSRKMSIEIHFKKLEEVKMEGAGNLSSQGILQIDTFSLSCWGSGGDADIKLSCIKSYISLHIGPSNIKIQGETDISYVYSGDFGSVDMRDYRSKTAYVNSTAFGETYVWVDTYMDIEITDIGNVWLKGNPVIGVNKISGKGKLLTLD
jgi:hypothetical protein